MSLRLLDALTLEDGSRWGSVATETQRSDALAILDRDSSPRFFWLGRARGWSKTVDLAGIALEVLLAQAPPGSRSYAFAADRDQAALLVDALAGFVQRGGPPLQEALEVQAWKIVNRKTGASLEAMAADEASAWGLRPFFVVCDELPMWPETRGARRLWEAVSSAVPKTPGSRLVVAGTAGDPGHWSARVRAHAFEDELWKVSEVAGPPPWMDPALIEEQRRRLPEASFQRLFENRWVTGESSLVAEEDLVACVTLDGPQPALAGFAYVGGLDAGLKRDRTVATICHREHGILFLDRIAVWEGSRLRPVKLGEVEEWLVRAAREYRCEWVFDPWQTAQLAERLRARNVRVREYAFTAQSVGRLASTLFQLLRDRAIRLPDDEELLDELRNVRLRESTPGVLRLDHDAGRHDDRAISVALACQRLLEQGERGSGMRVFSAQGRIDGAPLARRDSIPEPEQRALAARYGTALGHTTSFARRRLRRIPGAGKPNALDRRLEEVAGIDRWSVDRGRAELDALIDRARDGR